MDRAGFALGLQLLSRMEHQEQGREQVSPEVREHAVRLVLETEGHHSSRWQAVMSIAAKIGCTAQALNEWVKKAEVDSGRRAGVPTEMAEKSEPLSAIGPRTMASAYSAMLEGSAASLRAMPERLDRRSE